MNNAAAATHTEETWEYVVVDNQVYPVNTGEEIQVAEAALLSANQSDAWIWELNSEPNEDEAYADARKTCIKIAI